MELKPLCNHTVCWYLQGNHQNGFLNRGAKWISPIHSMALFVSKVYTFRMFYKGHHQEHHALFCFGGGVLYFKTPYLQASFLKEGYTFSLGFLFFDYG